MKLPRHTALALVLALSSISVTAAPLTVVDAHGGGLKKGQRIDSAQPITLKEGERVTLVSQEGKRITLRGKFSGLPMTGAGTATDSKPGVGVLVGTRNGHQSVLGAGRSFSLAAPLPQ